MKPSRHIKSTAVLSAALWPLLGWRALLVLAGGTILDLDRYAWYAVRHRALRLRDAMRRFQGRDRLRGDPRVLHSVEFLALLGVTCAAAPAIWPLALGVGFHLLLDVMLHKSRGRFWLYADFSHLQCLTRRLLRRRAGEATPAAAERPSSEQDA